MAAIIDRFLHEPKKPMVLAVQRPDERKNLSTLIHSLRTALVAVGVVKGSG